MDTLQNFIDKQADMLLEQEDLVGLTGGTSDPTPLQGKPINVLADCGTTNNCQSGNCSTSCGVKDLPTQP